MFAHVATNFLYHAQFGRSSPVSAQTLISYKNVIRYLGAFFIDKKVRDIEVDDVIELRKTLIDKGCSSGYMQRILSVLRAILRYTSEELGVECLPVHKVKLPPKQKHDVEYLSIDQVEAFIKSIDTSNLQGVRTMALVSTLLDTGMRISEVLSLNRDSINFTARTAYVIGKGNKKRMVLFRDWSLWWIKQYQGLRKDDQVALFTIHHHGYPLKRLAPDDVRRSFRRHARKIKIKVTPHTMRRTAATTLWINGGDMRTIQLFLGHSSVKITESYVGIDYSRLQKAHQEFMHYGDIEQHGDGVIIRWAKGYDKCTECGTTERAHSARGFCTTCYMQHKRSGAITPGVLPALAPLVAGAAA